MAKAEGLCEWRERQRAGRGSLGSDRLEPDHGGLRDGRDGGAGAPGARQSRRRAPGGGRGATSCRTPHLVRDGPRRLHRVTARDRRGLSRIVRRPLSGDVGHRGRRAARPPCEGRDRGDGGALLVKCAAFAVAALLLSSCGSSRSAPGDVFPAQSVWSSPPRPRLRASADTNDANAYYLQGVGAIAFRPDTAAAAFYWVTQLDPWRADAYYARAVALMRTLWAY